MCLCCACTLHNVLTSFAYATRHADMLYTCRATRMSGMSMLHGMCTHSHHRILRELGPLLEYFRGPCPPAPPNGTSATSSHFPSTPGVPAFASGHLFRAEAVTGQQDAQALTTAPSPSSASDSATLVPSIVPTQSWLRDSPAPAALAASC